uniref:Uncharacterized protein n=1 Tax=Strongyloides venezuelensis TaxID=75913 RepID=A0A0K0FDD3_STRVS
MLHSYEKDRNTEQQLSDISKFFSKKQSAKDKLKDCSRDSNFVVQTKSFFNLAFADCSFIKKFVKIME